MSVYPDSIAIEFFVSAAWSDRTTDVVREPISGGWGFRDNGPVDLIADTGEMTFLLNNQNDEYIPGLDTSLTGWDRNTPVRIKIIYNGDDYIRYRGYVDSLEVISEAHNRKWVRVTCIDWMDYAAQQPLIKPTIATNQRADQAITTIVSGMSLAPQATSYATGVETFPTVFDAVTPKTRVYSELAKYVKSEIGRLYVQKDRVNGETLVFEDRHFRGGRRTLDEFVTTDNDLLLETGDELLLETGFDLLLENSVVGALVFDNTMKSQRSQYGRDVINHFSTTAYPKKSSASNEVLFNLEKPIRLTPGIELEFRTGYSDPTGGNLIAADTDNMVTPVATTDYLMNTEEGGGGSDITADLTVTADYGTEGVSYTLKNDNADVGYVTFLQARGIGIFAYNPIQDIKENAASITSYGYHVTRLEQRYQQTTEIGSLFGDIQTNFERNPRLDLQSIRLVANRNQELMTAFLLIDIGDLINIKEDDLGIDGYYYIQGIDFTILPGNYIEFSITVRQSFSLLNGLSMLAIDFDGDSTTAGVDGDGIDFKSLPHLQNQTLRSFSVWIYKEQTSASLSRFIFGIYEDNAFASMWVTTDDRLQFIVNLSTAQGRWHSDASTLPNDAWTHIVVTHDVTTPTDPPIFYLNGSSVTVNEIVAPVGTISDQTGAKLTMGNVKTATLDWTRPFYGKILDARVYGSILSSANVTTLYNSGTFDSSLLINDDLDFQAACVKTADASDFTDAAFSSTDRVIDNMFGYVGTPNNGPIGRTPP